MLRFFITNHGKYFVKIRKLIYGKYLWLDLPGLNIQALHKEFPHFESLLPLIDPVIDITSAMLTFTFWSFTIDIHLSPRGFGYCVKVGHTIYSLKCHGNILWKLINMGFIGLFELIFKIIQYDTDIICIHYLWGYSFGDRAPNPLSDYPMIGNPSLILKLLINGLLESDQHKSQFPYGS